MTGVSRRGILSLAGAAIALPAILRAQGVQITKVADGLEEPWGLAFLPSGAFLVTERPGTLLHFAADGSGRTRITGVPKVAHSGQGGLLDVLVTGDFARSGRIWLSFAAAAKGGAGSCAGFGTLRGTDLQGFRRVLRPRGQPGGRHFGARLAERPDGGIFLTTGDRGNGDLAQRVDGPEGKVLSYSANGQPQTHKAFAGLEDVWPGLFSIGHRNIQAAALNARGQLMTAEHGARGGDEVNLVTGGQNHGWPVISYGKNYDGSKIGTGHSRAGMEQPLHYWDPSIAPSGLAICSGRMFPDWRGNLLIGSLNSDFISVLNPAKGYSETRLSRPETARVRDVAEAPDGAIWFLSVTHGAVFRISA